MIQKTTNYDQFKFVNGNRTLNQGHLAKLTVSISKRNLLEYAPILVNEAMEVIDGQHRLEVAKQNKWPIYYLVVPRSGLDEIIELNTTLRNWKLKDFIDSMIVLGNKTMLYLRGFCDDYALSPSIGILLHVGGLAGGSLNSKTLLERLRFNPEQREIAHRAADLLFDVRQLSNRKGMLPRSVAYAARRLAQEKKDVVVANAIKTRGKIIAISTDTDEMYEILLSYVK
jgi:hypothetical protein